MTVIEPKLRRPETLTAVEAAAAIESGALTCEALARACLERIALREPIIHAWTVIDSERALARARELDRTPRRGPLHGLLVAAKDIIATTDFPTRYGSPIYADNVPRADASCIAILRAAGAVIPGKTVTTEFAYFQPGPTANPANPAHTPGGSSSGSAAAVADTMVPLGLGTQTAGSITRPAAYCGIVGFKPTFGRLDLTGVKLVAPSLDTLGGMARSAADIELLRSALTDEAYRPLDMPSTRLRVGVYRTADWPAAEAASRQVVLDAAAVLRRYADVVEIDAVHYTHDVVETQRQVMAFEAARSLAHEYDRHRGELSDHLRKLIETGLAIPYDDYVGAQQRALAARTALRTLFAVHDLLLTPSAPGEAPAGLDATGDPLFSRAWTLLGVPSVTIPVSTGPHGLPLGIQLIGPWDADRRLLAMAQWISGLLR